MIEVGQRDAAFTLNMADFSLLSRGAGKPFAQVAGKLIRLTDAADMPPNGLDDAGRRLPWTPARPYQARDD